MKKRHSLRASLEDHRETGSLDDDEYLEGNEASDPADTVEEIAQLMARDRLIRRCWLLDSWLPIPGSPYAISHHGDVGRFVDEDRIVSDDSPEARAAVDAFLARLRAAEVRP